MIHRSRRMHGLVPCVGIALVLGSVSINAQVTIEESVVEEISLPDSADPDPSTEDAAELQAIPDIQIDVDQMSGYGNLIDQINQTPAMRDAGLEVTADSRKWLIEWNGKPLPADQSLSSISIESIQFIAVQPDAGPEPDGGVVSIETAQEDPD